MTDRHTINTIQAMRGFAAIFVVVLHSFVHLEARGHIADIPRLAEASRLGVDIFFVISGFIMVYISGDHFGKPGAARRFLIRRIIRIAPIYWIYTGLMASLLLLVPQLASQGKQLDILHLLASVVFVPWENNIGQIKPVLQAGWTLNYEMYFYLVFAALLLLNKRLFLPLMSALLLAGILAGILLQTDSVMFHVVTSPLLLEFLLGCAIGVLYKRGIDIPTSVLVGCLVVGACTLLATGLFDVSWIHLVIKWGIPAALLITGCVFLERQGRLNAGSFLNALGTSSYSIYLSHTFTVNAIGIAWAKVIGGWYGLYVVVTIVCSVIIGHLAWLILEKNITSWLNARLAK